MPSDGVRRERSVAGQRQRVDLVEVQVRVHERRRDQPALGVDGEPGLDLDLALGDLDVQAVGHSEADDAPVEQPRVAHEDVHGHSLPPRQASPSLDRSAYVRIQACMAMAAAAEALIERVEPNWAIEKVPPSTRLARGRVRQAGALLAEEEAHRPRDLHGLQVRRAGQVVDAEQRHVPLVEVRRQVGHRRRGAAGAGSGR